MFNMDKDKLAKSTTTSGRPPEPGKEKEGAPEGINPVTGQHTSYWVLSEEERKKGFVRPVRRSYVHIGVQPKYPLQDLTEEQKKDHSNTGYIKYEEYPATEYPSVGRYWTQKQLDSGCGNTTIMSQEIAETYAREPGYYGSTFCLHCGVHLPVEEFVWINEDRGSPQDEVVGS